MKTTPRTKPPNDRAARLGGRDEVLRGLQPPLRAPKFSRAPHFEKRIAAARLRAARSLSISTTRRGGIRSSACFCRVNFSRTGLVRADRRRHAERYGFFKHLGFFGIEPQTQRGARTFLRTTHALLASSLNAVWLTPQGRFVDVRERPLRLQKGLGALAVREPGAIFFRSRSSIRSGPSRGRKFLSPSASHSFRGRARASRRRLDPHLHRSPRNRAGRTRAALLPPRHQSVGHTRPREVGREWNLRRLALAAARDIHGEKFQREHHGEVSWDDLDRRRKLRSRPYPGRAFPAQSPALPAAAAIPFVRPAVRC